MKNTSNSSAKNWIAKIYIVNSRVIHYLFDYTVTLFHPELHEKSNKKNSDIHHNLETKQIIVYIQSKVFTT